MDYNDSHSDLVVTLLCLRVSYRAMKMNSHPSVPDSLYEHPTAIYNWLLDYIWDSSCP